MPSAGAGRIDLHELPEGAIRQVMKQESLGQRAPADVSHADEKDPINGITSKI